VALKPTAVVILSGINDVQGFLQQETPEQIEANWESMADLADAHHIKVVFGAILPVNNYTDVAKDVVKEHKPEQLVALNVWLRTFCAARGYGFADYHAALVDPNGLMTAAYTQDGVHPLDNGYAVMAPIAQRAIEQVLGQK
jgi:lysophospholipase L1-like esterase